jgi:predicted O-methyltransferase YrrM
MKFSGLLSPIRSVGIALLTPTYHFYRSGHFRSALARAAVDKNGAPLPWYTYGCIHFLQNLDFGGRRVLEFGGGQSTLWWAKRAAEVLSLEENPVWRERISKQLPANAKMEHIEAKTAEICVRECTAALARHDKPSYDIIVIDGPWRADLAALSIASLSKDGAIICDNAEGYGFFEAFKDSGLNRVDFFGVQPGVFQPGSTSIYFPDGCFLFKNRFPITPP